MFSACVCLLPAFAGWCHVPHAGFLTHSDYAGIFQSNRGASIQCAHLTEGCVFCGQESGGLHVRVHEQRSVMEEKEQTYEQQGYSRECRHHEQRHLRPVVSPRVCCTHGSQCCSGWGKLRRRICDSQRRTMHRQRCLPKSLPSARISVLPRATSSHGAVSVSPFYSSPNGVSLVQLQGAIQPCCLSFPLLEGVRAFFRCNTQTQCDQQPFVHLHVRRRISNYPQSFAVYSRSRVHDCWHHTVCTSGPQDNFVMCSDWCPAHWTESVK